MNKNELARKILCLPEETKITVSDINFINRMICTLLRKKVNYNQIRQMLKINLTKNELFKLFGIDKIQCLSLDDIKKMEYRKLCNFNLTNEDKEKIIGKENLGKKGYALDHRVSVNYGYKNNLPPEHISHPANCEVIHRTVNLRKSEKCSITYDDLLEEIDNWGNINFIKNRISYGDTKKILKNIKFSEVKPTDPSMWFIWSNRYNKYVTLPKEESHSFYQIVEELKLCFIDYTLEDMLGRKAENDFEIDYFYRGIIGNYTIRYSEHDYIKEIKDLVKNNNLMDNSLYVWQFDKDDQFKEFLSNSNSIEIPTKSHGLNEPEWMTYNKVTIAANYKITPMEKLVCDALDIEPEILIEARHVNMIIQIMTRCEVRRTDLPKIKIIVSDEDTAERIANRLSNSKNKIITNHLGLEKKTRSESKKPTISPPKEKIRSKINYLKKKKKLTSTEKLKLHQLQEEYKDILLKK